MPETLIRGRKYRGKFEGDKREANEIEVEGEEAKSHHHWCYDGAGLIHKFKSNSKKYFFRFLVRENYCKSSLKDTLEKLASRGRDSFLELIILKIKESQKQIPKIYLPK